MAYSKKKLQPLVGAFLKHYKRTSRRQGMDPNDRHYDRRLEEILKKMRPEELSKLINNDEDEPTK